jgi:hypothetical protein
MGAEQRALVDVGTSVGHPKQDRDPDKPQDSAAHGPCPSRGPETANAGQVQRRRIRMPKPITDQGPMGTAMPTHRARSPRGPGSAERWRFRAGQCGGHPDACLQAGRSFQRRLLLAVFTLDGLKLCRQCRHVGSGLRHVVTARRRPRVFLGSGVHGVSPCEVWDRYS